MEKMNNETRKRVENELGEVGHRIASLQLFLADKTDSHDQDVEELRNQLTVMNEYYNILERRLKTDAAKDGGSPATAEDVIAKMKEDVKKIYNEVDEMWYRASTHMPFERDELQNRLADWKNRLYEIYTTELPGQPQKVQCRA